MARLPVHTRPASGSTDVGAVAGGVTSVFGRTGAVVSAVSDYDASQVDNDSSVAGARVSDALNTLLSADATLTAALAGKLGATAAAGGDLSGNYPNPTVAKIKTATVNGTPDATKVLYGTAAAACEWTWVTGNKILLEWNGTNSLASLTNGGTADVLYNAGAWTTTPVITKSVEAENVGGNQWDVVMRSNAASLAAAVFWLNVTVPAKYRIEMVTAACTVLQPGFAFMGASASNYFYTAWSSQGDRFDNGVPTLSPIGSGSLGSVTPGTANMTYVLSVESDKRASTAPKFNARCWAHNGSTGSTTGMKSIKNTGYASEPASNVNWGGLTFNRVGLSFATASISNATCKVWRIRVVDET